MRHSGKSIRQRAARRRSDHIGKTDPNIDAVVWIAWLGFSLLMEQLDDRGLGLGTPSRRGARRPEQVD